MNTEHLRAGTLRYFNSAESIDMIAEPGELGFSSLCMYANQVLKEDGTWENIYKDQGDSDLRYLLDNNEGRFLLITGLHPLFFEDYLLIFNINGYSTLPVRMVTPEVNSSSYPGDRVRPGPKPIRDCQVVIQLPLFKGVTYEKCVSILKRLLDVKYRAFHKDKPKVRLVDSDSLEIADLRNSAPVLGLTLAFAKVMLKQPTRTSNIFTGVTIDRKLLFRDSVSFYRKLRSVIFYLNEMLRCETVEELIKYLRSRGRKISTNF